MQKIIKLLTLVVIISVSGCSKEASFSGLKDESGDVFTPIKDSDFDPIPAVNVEPYVDAVKDICVEGCYTADNPKIDFSWSNSNLPGNVTVAEILGGSEITIATKQSLEYNPAPQEANYNTPGTSDSTKPSPDSVGKDIADMQLKARQEDMDRRNQEAKAAINAREKQDELQSNWIKNFREASKEVADFENKSRESLAANTANSPKITASGSYSDLSNTINQGRSGRDLAKKRIEEGLPKVQIKPNPNVHQYKTHAQTIEGLAVRRADSYLGYAQRSIENPGYPAAGKDRARKLLNDAQNTLDYADSKYSAGQTGYGNKGLEITYALADMAMAVAPFAIMVAFPQAAIIAVGIEAFNLGKAWYEYKSGKRLYDGKELSPFQKDMALMNVGFAALPPIGLAAFQTFKTARSALPFVSEMLMFNGTTQEAASVSNSLAIVQKTLDVSEAIGISEPSKINRLAESAADAGLETGRALDTLIKISKSDDFATAVQSTPANKPMFYVKPTGEAVPSTGYRHFASNDPFVQSIIRNDGTIGPWQRGNYVTFDKIDNAALASSKLQVQHDAVIRMEFDTAHIADDLYIPNGRWGEADYLEPITSTMPEFGEGGATQAVTKGAIKVDKIVDLVTGEVLFQR